MTKIFNVGASLVALSIGLFAAAGAMAATDEEKAVSAGATKIAMSTSLVARKAFIGRTVEGVDYKVFYSRDGKNGELKYKEKMYIIKITTPDGKFCRELNGKTSCFNAYKVGDKQHYFKTNGTLSSIEAMK